MRLPSSTDLAEKSIEIVRYRPSSKGSCSDRFIADFEDTDALKGPGRVRIPIDSRSKASFTSEETDGFANVLVPRVVSPRSKSRGWKRLVVEDDGASAAIAAWLIWPHGRVTDTQPCVLIYPQQDMARFMATLPDETPWQELALVGTHDSCAFYGYYYAQCQQPATSITQQLNDGVRSLDLRMKVKDGELIMYHGIRTQRAHFTFVLAEIHDFLASHPSEAIHVSMQQEVPPIHPDFASLVWTAMATHVDQFWYLETRLPTLGEARGRAILMPRFTIPEPQPGMWDKGIGLKLDSWPDNNPDGFELPCGEDSIRVQDWYGVSSFLRIPEKLKVIQDHLEPTLTTAPPSLSRPKSTPDSDTPRRPLTISYLSAAHMPLGPPCVLAKGFGWPSIGLGVEGLNSRFIRWLLSLMCDGKRVRGIVPVDFYREEGDIAGLLVAMSHFGRDDLVQRMDGENGGEATGMGEGRSSGETLREAT